MATDQKLPKDLAPFPMWSARLALTAIISQCVEAMLEQRGQLIELPGQRMKYCSEANALECLEEFCNKTGAGAFLHQHRKDRKVVNEMSKRIQDKLQADRDWMSKKPR